MRVSCDRLKLAEAFSVVSGLAAKGHSREAFQCVKLDSSPSGSWLSATNGETSIRLELDGVDGAAAGSVLLNVARVGQIIRESTDDHLTISVDGAMLLITTRTSEFRLNSIDPKEYPSVPGWDQKSWVELPCRWLREAIKRTSFSTDDTSTRFALGGIRFEMNYEVTEGDDPKIHVIATDGRRLAVVTGPVKEVGSQILNYGAIVPTAAMSLVAKSLGDRDEAVKMAVTSADAIFSIGRTTITTRQVEGRYPNWRQVLPKRENSAKIPMTVGPTHAVIRQAAIVADSESRGVDFKFHEGSMLLEASTADSGHSHVELPIQYDGDAIRMRMDYRFVCDFLKALDPAAAFTLDVQSSTASALLTTNDGYSYVVMPMALDK